MVAVIELRGKKESKKYQFNYHTVIKYSKKSHAHHFTGLLDNVKYLPLTLKHLEMLPCCCKYIF